tara:strand:- start:1267 stop:3840 length:2574 start_codon:yes stop_codon:yes gene_type:complete
MISPSKATLNGYPILGSSPVTWSLRAGVHPVTQVFDMTPDDAEALVGGTVVGKIDPKPADPGGVLVVESFGPPVKYNISAPSPGSSGRPGKIETVELCIEAGGNKVSFKNLYITGYAPRIVPHISRVTISDRRWLWGYGHVGPRRYNWRRRGGYKRIVDPATPETIQDVRDNVWYAGFSLFVEPGENNVPAYRKWKASELLDNIFGSVEEIENEYSGNSFSFGGESDLFGDIGWEGAKRSLDEIPIENLLIDDSGDKAIERALAYLPGWNVFIDPDGNPRLYDKSSGMESEEWEKMGAPKVGGGLGDVISNRFRRPRNIRVLFTREVELRFDYDELETVDSQPPGDFSKRLEMTNVVSVPDFKLNLPSHGAVASREVSQGTWVNLYEALKAWNESSRGGGASELGWPGVGVLDINFLRRSIVPFVDLWTGVGLSGQTDPSADWLGRANALKSHFRRTFQLNSYWWDRILSVKNVRIAILDKETGSRAPSTVYSSFCRIANNRSFYREKFSNVNQNFAINANAYPVGSGIDDPDKAVSYPLSSLKPSESRMIAADARVNIIDPEQGVIQIEYVPDIFHAYDIIIPGQIALPNKDGEITVNSNGVVSDTGPSSDIKDFSSSIAFDTVMLNSEHRIPQAISDYKIAVILSVIPATWDRAWTDSRNPISSRSERSGGSLLEVVNIKSDDDRLSGMVSSHVADGLKDCVGPDLEVRVGAGVEVARVAWNDTFHKEIKGIFGVYSSSPPELPSGLVINRSGDGVGVDNMKGASLDEIALAVAARVYSGMVDHLQGAETGDLIPTDGANFVKPSGWLDEVTYELATSGEGSIIVDFPEEVEKFDLLSYMDESTRATILRLAQPG